MKTSIPQWHFKEFYNSFFGLDSTTMPRGSRPVCVMRACTGKFMVFKT